MNGWKCLTIVIGTVAATTATSAEPANTAAPQTPACLLHVAAGLDMETMPDGRVTVPVKFEGHDHKLMVDTGGYINTVTRQLVREEGYVADNSRGASLQGIGNRVLKTFVEAKDFAIGNAHGSGFIFYVDVFNNLLADGTLAPEILANYDVDFDFGHGRFNLIQPQHCISGAVYWTKSPAEIIPIEIEDKTHIRIPVTIDGKKIMATVDTGSAASIITMRAAARLLDVNEKSADLQSLGAISVNGMVAPVYVYPFQQLAIGHTSVTRPRIEIVSDALWNKDDLLLGMDFLRQFHVYVAYQEKKLYFTPALAN